MTGSLFVKFFFSVLRTASVNTIFKFIHAQYLFTLGDRFSISIVKYLVLSSLLVSFENEEFIIVENKRKFSVC